jgi:hypothetical protein
MDRYWNARLALGPTSAPRLLVSSLVRFFLFFVTGNGFPPGPRTCASTTSSSFLAVIMLCTPAEPMKANRSTGAYQHWAAARSCSEAEGGPRGSGGCGKESPAMFVLPRQLTGQNCVLGTKQKRQHLEHARGAGLTRVIEGSHHERTIALPVAIDVFVPTRDVLPSRRERKMVDYRRRPWWGS